MKLLIFILITTTVSENFANVDLRFHWSNISYDFGISKNGKRIIKGDSFRIWSNVFTGIAIWKQVIYLSTIRENFQLYGLMNYQPSLEKTISPLNYIHSNAAKETPLLTPYEKEEEHEIKNVNHMEIDACNRLWTIDRVTQELLIIDLLRNKTLTRHKLNKKALKMNSISVDVNNTDCENAYIYMPYFAPNLTILVYYLNSNKCWKIKEPVYPSYMTTYDYISFVAPTSTLSDTNEDGYKTLYIQARWSSYIFSISTKYLQTSNAVLKEKGPHFKILGLDREDNGESNLVYYDHLTGVLFYDSDRGQKLACWNTRKYPNELSAKTLNRIVLFSKPEFMFALRGDGEGNLWIGTRKTVQRFPLKRDEFYLYKMDIRNFTRNTICE